MEPLEALINLGLNEKEARVYLALLPLEKTTAYTVAVRSNLKKPTAYVILDNLVGKGFVLKIPGEKKHYFLAKSPKECIAIAREKFYAAEESLPALIALQKNGAEKASVSYYEGFDGIRKMYEKLLKNMKEKTDQEKMLVGFYAHQKHTPEFLQKYWLELNEKFRKIKIKRSALTTLHPSLKYYLQEETKRKYMVHLKTLPEKDYSSNISIEIYDQYTQIISHRHLQGIIIENQDIADVMKQIFNLVWKKEN